jgi:CDP-glycerol glycerophosphotransferase
MDGTSNGNEPDYYQGSPDLLISLVLPVYNAQSHLSNCLEAITRQSSAEIEIIVVDGASNDGSEKLLGEWARIVPRMTVRRTRDQIGPGKARNLGAELAIGEYLWFVDADDTIAADCLPAIAHCLKVNAPDVLLVGYELIDPRGRIEPGPVDELANGMTAACFTIAEYPQLLAASMASWNKIVRRSFFTSCGAAFSERWPHEDIKVSSLLLLEASKLSMLSQVCYRYSKDRPGSSMQSGDPRRHFKVFDAWRPVLEYAGTRVKASDSQVTDKVYLALFERAIWHCSTQLETGGWGIGKIGIDGYVARRDRREFFDRMSDCFRHYAPVNYVLPPGPRGVKFGLIQRGNYLLYSMLEPMNKLRTKIRRSAHALRGSPA